MNFPRTFVTFNSAGNSCWEKTKEARGRAVCTGNGEVLPPLPLPHGSERHSIEGLAAKFVG